MNCDGYYDGWSDHSVIIDADLAFGCSIRVTGRDRKEIKEYIAETVGECLRERISLVPRGGDDPSEFVWSRDDVRTMGLKIQRQKFVAALAAKSRERSSESAQ